MLTIFYNKTLVTKLTSSTVWQDKFNKNLSLITFHVRSLIWIRKKTQSALKCWIYFSYVSAFFVYVTHTSHTPSQVSSVPNIVPWQDFVLDLKCVSRFPHGIRNSQVVIIAGFINRTWPKFSVQHGVPKCSSEQTGKSSWSRGYAFNLQPWVKDLNEAVSTIKYQQFISGYCNIV